MRCECGHDIQIGEWPFCPDHSRPVSTKGFEPFVDDNIADHPVTITSGADYKKHFKPRWENDHIVHLQPRDKSASYYRELNDRREERAHRK